MARFGLALLVVGLVLVGIGVAGVANLVPLSTFPCPTQTNCYVVDMMFNVKGKTVNFAGTVANAFGATSYHWTWTFGDGKQTEQTTVSYATEVSHTYLLEGKYTVVLSVETTDIGVWTGSATRDVTTDGAPGERPLKASFTWTANETRIVVKGGASGGALPYSFAWDWGDRTAGGNKVNESHVYNSSGTYTVVLTVLDANLQSETVSSEVKVGGADCKDCPSGGDDDDEGFDFASNALSLGLFGAGIALVVVGARKAWR